MSEQHSVPVDFYCEHTPSKSRVHALVSPGGGPRVLQAVLTCNDPELARNATGLLSAAWHGGEGPAVRAEAERILALLPAAPAASLRNALNSAFAGHWPAPTHSQGTGHTADAPAADLFADGEEDEDEELTPATVDALARTPSGARLADLPGQVVRITSLIDVHVHDPKRLLAAARATGWTPLTEQDEKDPDDIVGAVMALADHPQIPGTDNTDNEMTGELLHPRKGDELSPWSSSPITATFTSGWGLRRPPQPLHSRETRWGTMPDFAKIFPVECACGSEGCTTCDAGPLTPRSADLIHTALSTMADAAYDDLQEHDDDPVPNSEDPSWGFFTDLPRLALQQPRQWRREMARACDDLAEDLEAGELPIPRCFAEELVLHLALDQAPDILEEKQDLEDEDHESLPKHPYDYDWGLYGDQFFQDSDILLLYQEALDGIEDPTAHLNGTNGIGDMRPANWFTPFNNVTPRDPNRGFRR
ncbi:hypothetical protein [Actinomadura gamaensis]|uniref:Uncharacterized protein n=1 Tax=Actinomadura gamaensis TaxID=1763541 RepID=A0ABV9UA19_9ACTN